MRREVIVAKSGIYVCSGDRGEEKEEKSLFKGDAEKDEEQEKEGEYQKGG